MNQKKDLAELTDLELIAEGKKIKSNNITTAVLFGVIIGIAVYSTVVNGVGLFTLLPFLFAPLAANNAKKNKTIEKLLKERNLK